MGAKEMHRGREGNPDALVFHPQGSTLLGC